MKFQIIQFLIAAVTLGTSAVIAYVMCQDIMKKIDDHKKENDQSIKELNESIAQVLEMMNPIHAKADRPSSVKKKKEPK